MIPQFDLGLVGRFIGGLKKMVQRSGIVTRMITMVSAMISAWSTTPALRDVFGTFWVFLAVVLAGLTAYMLLDYSLIFPAELAFGNHNSETSERSPIKHDTEEIKQLLREERDAE